MNTIFLELETFFSSPASSSSLQREEIKNKEEHNWPRLAWPSWPTTDDADVRVSLLTATANFSTADSSTTDGVKSDLPISKSVRTHSADDISNDVATYMSFDVVNINPSFLVLDHQYTKNSLKVSTYVASTVDLDTTNRYVLPDRSNHRKLPNQYSPKAYAKQSRYPITNYVSIHWLSEPLNAFVQNVSSAHISSNAHATLIDSNWTQVTKDDMLAFEEKHKWTLVQLSEGKKT